jgi:hypothetical protein
MAAQRSLTRASAQRIRRSPGRVPHTSQQRDASRRACTRRFSAGPSYGTRSGAEPSWAAHRQRDGTRPLLQMFATENTDNDIVTADSDERGFLRAPLFAEPSRRSRGT